MSRRRFYVDKETGYYNDGRKNEVFSIDCDGNFVLQAISREEMLELIQVLTRYSSVLSVWLNIFALHSSVF